MREREVQMKRKAKMAKRLERKAHKRATKDDPKDPAARDVTAEFVTGIPAPSIPMPPPPMPTPKPTQVAPPPPPPPAPADPAVEKKTEKKLEKK